MLIDTTVNVGQNVQCFLNKKARGKVIGVDGSHLTVQWSNGNIANVSRHHIIVMKPGY